MAMVGMEGSLAMAEAARLANVDVVAAYPITPQTHIVERLAEMVANGELNASYIPVESEHSAMSACLGSSATGARTFTATAGQGLELMHEALYVASGMRLPIVMGVANRALSSPLSVWGDHSDVMAVRDTGWIQIFAENGQQAFDLTLCAFRIAEDPKVLFPVMVHIDGFHLSHVVEPLYLLDQEQVNSFLPPFRHPFPLDPDAPVSMGAFTVPILYSEARKSMETALRSTRVFINHVFADFAKLSGRPYNALERYRSEDADTLLLTMGSFSQIAMDAVDQLRDRGEKVGLVRLRLWRPFPFEELRQAVRDCQTLVVLDRCVSPGGPPGPVCSEVKAALYSEKKRPNVAGFIGGLGGRDLSPAEFVQMVERGRVIAAEGGEEIEMIGVRG